MLTGLAPGVVNNLVEYLTYEIQRARSERSELEADWIRYEKLYRAKPAVKEQDFPWKGAANLTIPVSATDVDTTVAGLVGVIFSAPNIWSTEALRPDWMDFAARLEEYLEWAQEAELQMYGTVVDWVTEIVKLGTGVLKQRYVREQKKMFEWRETPSGIVQQSLVRLAVDRPDVRRVPLPNFYVPGYATQLQESPWVGEKLDLSWIQLQNRVKAGIYAPDFLDRIGAHWRSQRSTSQWEAYRSAQEQLDDFIPSFKDSFELFEFWLRYDLGDGEPCAIVCTIHEPSRALARIDYNPFFHQEFPYSIARFLRQPGRIYGIGLCEMLEQVQIEISTMHNQRIDQGTVRNAAMFAARRGSGVKQDEPIWPGRVLLLDNPEDIKALPMGYPAQSTLDEEQALLNYGRQRSSVSDYQRGGSGTPAISYSTATTVIEMLKQGRLRLDQVLREIQFGLSETGQRVVELYQQYAQGPKPYTVLGQKDGAILDSLLHFPLDLIRTGVSIKVTATNAQVNRETKIRTDQIIFGLVMNFYQQLFQAMGIVVNPQIPEPLRVLAGQMIQGGLILARRILDNYGQQDVDRIIPDLDQLNATVQQLTGIQGGAPNTGQPQPTTGAGGGFMGSGPMQPSGFPALSAGTPGIYGAGTPTPPFGAGTR